jgi:tetratricopeptide (TPR) repeat protein
LALLRELPRDARREFALRLELSEFYAEIDQLPDAEDELRHAEELAIEQNAARWLARVYLVLGALRGRQRDESGFVFFEKAIELSRSGEPSPRLEAEAYIGYADFRSTLGDVGDARACLERAREILSDLDDAPLAASVERALARYAMA